MYQIWDNLNNGHYKWRLHTFEWKLSYRETDSVSWAIVFRGILANISSQIIVNVNGKEMKKLLKIFVYLVFEKYKYLQWV